MNNLSRLLMLENCAINCNLCGGEKFTTVEDHESPIYVLKCLHCNLVFVHPQPVQDFFPDHYNEEYYREWIGPQRKKRSQMWKRRLRAIEKEVPKGRLLDIGCGLGEFLLIAQKNGWDVEGTELSPYSAELVSKLLNKPIYCGHVTKAGYEASSFDVITFWHVLEHVTDPTHYLQEARRLIKPSGLLVIATPNLDDWVMRTAYRVVKGKPLRLYSKHDREVHLYHFRDETLRRYLDKTGFQCLSISPDFGIIETSKRFINAIAVLLSIVTGRKLYNSLKIRARPL